MEIKAELKKPYTEDERLDFIIEQNHQLGYEIKETETSLQALGLTDDEIVQGRKEIFHRDFFLTSLGYIRRTVSMATGEVKDFLCDLVPAMTSALSQGIITPIITYKEPDFTIEPTLEYMESLQEVKDINAEFLKECAIQLQNDFYKIGAK